jgi:hypothetical protein
MDAVDELRRPGLVLRPPLTASQIDALAAEVGAPLPGELRLVLRVTSGIATPVVIDFEGRSLSYGDEEIFPVSHAIAGDGFGNHWVLDVTPAADGAAVFFASHDPPVVMYEASDLAHFLHDVLERGSLADDSHRRRVFRIWGEDPQTLDYQQAIAGDDELRAFAADLNERFTIVDLRNGQVGDGFSWGRYGPRTMIRRHGAERLFAYGPPPRQNRPWLLRHLLRS